MDDLIWIAAMVGLSLLGFLLIRLLGEGEEGAGT